MGGQQHLHVRVQQNRQTQILAVWAVRLGRANDKGLYFFPQISYYKVSGGTGRLDL